MAVGSAIVAVPASSTPTPLVANVPAGQTDAISGDSYWIQNTGTVRVYLGGSDVDASKGFPVDPGVMGADEVAAGDVLYGFVPTGATAGSIALLRTR